MMCGGWSIGGKESTAFYVHQLETDMNGLDGLVELNYCSLSPFSSDSGNSSLSLEIREEIIVQLKVCSCIATESNRCIACRNC